MDKEIVLETFKQDVNEEELIKLVGKTILAQGTRPWEKDERKPFGFEGTIIGYIKEVVFFDGVATYKYAFLTDEGMSFSILKDMTWQEV